MSRSESAQPRWLSRLVLDAVHTDQLRQHGGLTGVRDQNALESALARPRNKWEYGARDLAALAAAYGFALVTSHPYRDGNKRIGFLAMVIFLGINGRLELQVSDQEIVTEMLSLAAGRVSEDDLAGWIRKRLADQS